MKKIKLSSLVSFVLAFAIALCGCGNTRDNSESVAESESVVVESEEEKEKIGGDYTLEALYDAGKLTQEDLLNIAYYSGNARYNLDLMGEDFVPTVEAELTEELEKEIQKTLAQIACDRKINPASKFSPETYEIEYY